MFFEENSFLKKSLLLKSGYLKHCFLVLSCSEDFVDNLADYRYSSVNLLLLSCSPSPFCPGLQSFPLFILTSSVLVTTRALPSSLSRSTLIHASVPGTYEERKTHVRRLIQNHAKRTLLYELFSNRF